jgi:hypothetical protein
MAKMDPKEQAAHDAAIAEYLANGGKITICEKDARTEGLVTNIWKRGPGRPTKEQAEKDAKKDGEE